MMMMITGMSDIRNSPEVYEHHIQENSKKNLYAFYM